MRTKTLIILYSAIILIIIKPSISIAGATSGLNLWFHTIIPTLFPFFIISNMLINVYGNSFKNPIFFTAAIGSLCGFPICANLTSKLLEEQRINRATAQFLVNCFNIASPMFVFAYAVGYGLKNNMAIPFIIIIYIANILGMIIAYFRLKPTLQCTQYSETVKLTGRQVLIILDNAIYSSCQTIIKIGGYIIIFSIISNFMNTFLKISDWTKALLLGIIEMTNGIGYTSVTNVPIDSKFVLLAAVVSFGGLCTVAQTNCVIKPHTISLKKYIEHKYIVANIAFVLAYLFTQFFCD